MNSFCDKLKRKIENENLFALTAFMLTNIEMVYVIGFTTDFQSIERGKKTATACFFMLKFSIDLSIH